MQIPGAEPFPSHMIRGRVLNVTSTQAQQSPFALNSTSMESVKSVLRLPPRWLDHYAGFITENRASVTQIESALRSLTYVLPIHTLSASQSVSTTATPTSSDIVSESLHTSIQLLSLYHDSILFGRREGPNGARRAGQKDDEHTRYTTYWVQKSPLYRRIARLLAIVRYTELLWEMAAKRKGERVRWRVVILLEAIKAVCKLLLLRATKSRLLVNPLLPYRDAMADQEDEESLPPSGDVACETRHLMSRTNKLLPTLPPTDKVQTYLQNSVLSASDIRPVTSLLPPLATASQQASEYLYILTPLIYAVLVARTRRRTDGRHSWTPWLAGISLELLARQLRKDVDRQGFGAGRFTGTRLDREEWGKRGWAMAWWLMRGACYDNVSQGLVHGVRARLPSLLRGVLDDYVWLWDGYHFSTSQD